ncbi:hypothetical protein RvY_03087 [Ramazzottius varieornatus]|uniref:Uncharacterized protein n=1 Tax=Ramazzottius varieornatus TaxID=947166 RepID=A0A1D1UX26_RAMVA|nr:hypothetical protein RvY_03087 [Ramazzottius varieornatus]
MERVEAIVTLEKTHPGRIINFDQTSVLLQNTYGKTSSPVGVKQVHVVQPPGEKERFTVGLAVTGDGQKFPAVIVFTGGVKTGQLSRNILAKLVIPGNVNEGYMGITAHWAASEFELEELLLGFVSLHSGEPLKEEVMEILREYGIAHKTFGWTVDGAANMKAFFNDIKPELQLERQSQNFNTQVSEFRLRCVCHVMDNVAEVGVEDDLKIVSRIREMVKFVRKPKAKKQYIALRESEKDKDKDRHLRLPLDVSTRWNSTLPMLRGAYEARHHLKRYAATYGTTAFKKNLLKDSEWEDVSRLISFLVPLEQATNDCSASRCPTFHLGKQCLSILHDHIKKPYIKRTAAKMAAKLTSVEPDSWQQEAATVALLLDPRVKTNAFANPEEKLRAIEVLKKYVGPYSDQSIATVGYYTLCINDMNRQIQFNREAYGVDPLSLASA